MDDKQSIVDILGSFSKQAAEASAIYGRDCDTWWDNLSEQDKLKAFYSVVKRIHKGEIVDKGSYRYVLYNTFGFDAEAYGIGMECGYLDLHNAIKVEE